MGVKTSIKLAFVVIMTICALVFVFSGKVSERNFKKKNKNKKQMTESRTVVKIKLICFLVMLISLFICVVI